MSTEVLLGLLATAVCLLEGILLYRRRQRRNRMQEYVQTAKHEMQEMLLLALNNPYPLIQVRPDGTVLFKTPQADAAFPDLQTLGPAHPLLRDLLQWVAEEEGTGPFTREMREQGIDWLQTVKRRAVKDEHALLVYFYDISARKQQEEALRLAHQRSEAAKRSLQAANQALESAHAQTELARQEAEQANQARGDFLANMSHELRTPMNGIIGLSDMLKDAAMPKQQHDMIAAVNSSARNLLILLNDILDFSKIEAGELLIESIAFDIHAVVQQLDALHTSVASHKGLELRTKVDPATPTYLMGDPSRLQQIANNLLSNAIKFTHQGRVTLEVTYQDHQLTLAVADTGIGIPRHKLETVFAKFQQADSSTARKYGGTGLGLAITKELTELMHGQVSVHSVEGEGTTFTVTLPMKEADAETIAALKTEQGPLRVNIHARLLIVDDAQVNLMVLLAMLRKFGFHAIDEAHHGREAIAMAQEAAYDLILMDCQMPEMDGFEATRVLRQKGAAKGHVIPPIIAVTADAMKGAEAKCHEAGMQDYISKPIEQEKLAALLQRWLPASEDIPLTRQISAVQPVAPTSELFDLVHLQGFTDNDADLQYEFISVFLTSVAEEMQALTHAFKQQDWECWAKTAHKLHGIAANIGAQLLASYCDEAQELTPSDAARISELHPIIVRCHSQTRHVMQQLDARLMRDTG
ncbi:MAG: hypothetical protein CMM93_07330 [Rickettsiales bacterium]|nr:hypothetical protein [Rickettsiales bacterium]